MMQYISTHANITIKTQNIDVLPPESLHGPLRPLHLLPVVLCIDLGLFCDFNLV